MVIVTLINMIAFNVKGRQTPVAPQVAPAVQQSTAPPAVQQPTAPPLATRSVTATVVKEPERPIALLSAEQLRAHGFYFE